MQLKGLALKKTPIFADSAVIRHEGLDESQEVRGRCAKCDREVEAMTSMLNQTPFATCLSVGNLPNSDRCHGSLEEIHMYSVSEGIKKRVHHRLDGSRGMQDE